jgi:hypothetical protein
MISCCRGVSPCSHVAAPAPVLGGLTFRSVTAGNAYTCATSGTGAAYCWGSDIGNLVGTGVLGFFVAQPMAVAGAPAFQSLTTGDLHTCGLTASGVASCWGVWGSPAVGRPVPQVVATSPVPVSAL